GTALATAPPSIVCVTGPSAPGLAIRIETFTFDGAVCVATACTGADCLVSVLCGAIWAASALADTVWVTAPLSPALATLTETSRFPLASCADAAVASRVSGAAGATGTAGVAVAGTLDCPGAVSA